MSATIIGWVDKTATHKASKPSTKADTSTKTSSSAKASASKKSTSKKG